MKLSPLDVLAIVLFVVALALEFGDAGDGLTWAVVGVGVLILSRVPWRVPVQEGTSKTG